MRSQTHWPRRAVHKVPFDGHSVFAKRIGTFAPPPVASVASMHGYETCPGCVAHDSLSSSNTSTVVGKVGGPGPSRKMSPMNMTSRALPSPGSIGSRAGRQIEPRLQFSLRHSLQTLVYSDLGTIQITAPWVKSISQVARCHQSTLSATG